jgi:hypothetical protein
VLVAVMMDLCRSTLVKNKHVQLGSTCIVVALLARSNNHEIMDLCPPIVLLNLNRGNPN